MGLEADFGGVGTLAADEDAGFGVGNAHALEVEVLNGSIVVIMGRERLTFHEFSQSLVDLGATTAIYLVGSTGYCFYRTESGRAFSSGYRNQEVYANLNFLVWK